MHKSRAIEGAKCAQCEEPIGLLVVNGKSLEVEPSAVVWDDVVIFKLHLCRKAPPAGDLGPGVERGEAVVNGKRTRPNAR